MSIDPDPQNTNTMQFASLNRFYSNSVYNFAVDVAKNGKFIIQIENHFWLIFLRVCTLNNIEPYFISIACIWKFTKSGD